MIDRSEKILEAVIREFIATGLPISSAELYDNYDFGIKPASIRAELLRLTDDGFLEQPHTSGGRIPSEAGYEFFVNQIIAELFGKTMSGIFSFRDSLLDDLMRRRTESLVDDLSDELGVMTVGYEPGKKSIYKSGFDNLCEKVDMSNKQDFLEIVHDFEKLNGKLQKFAESLNRSDSPKVYIGKKSPITTSPELSVIADSYEIDGEPLLLIAVGPKRMDYKKPLRIFKAIREAHIKNQILKIKNK